ncbi:LURP1-related protein domain containing protein [Parasponia andersonii]|uniref:LURP1-related protein domain containing protein n=1 Tax=Parasponia andersonii TaxID=3476 RepID=A0A2P5CP65_PARAD|nr:LURP1-related protein domain containing protein [Parasponia andersonii]
MAKVHPQAPSFSPYLTSEKETFTIWMKSLVYHTNGCTVYNSNGQIVFRVDNYEKKCSSEVHLMDLKGKVIYTIRKKKLQAFGGWDGYRLSGSDMKDSKPWFRVTRHCKMLMGDLACQITVGCDKYRIVRLTGKAAGFRIVSLDGKIIAEAKQKQSSSGVVLGDDVLSLEVEPHKDHSLIMALVMVYGLIRRKM